MLRFYLFKYSFFKTKTMEIATDYKLFIKRKNGSNNQLIECDVVVPQSYKDELWKIMHHENIERENAVLVLSTNSNVNSCNYSYEIQTKFVNNEIAVSSNKAEVIDNTVVIPYNSPDEKLYTEFIKYIKENISNSEMNVDDIVATVGMSRAQLYRRLNTISGQTVKELVRNIRLKSAAKLLNYHDIRISEVMHMVGFTNRAYFIKCFKERYGKCPSDYKRQIENYIA